ncbi:MAG: hypothetical protein GXY58_01665 [Planctomycetaceae bacterium]|nr:hypothetical protein [Planctomycetaceae bacterium]
MKNDMNNVNDVHKSSQMADAVPPTGSRPVRTGSRILVAVIAVALVVAVLALSRLDTWGERADATPRRFELDLQEQAEIPPELVAYVQRAQFETALERPQALTTSADGTILVAGDQAVVRLSSAGEVLATIPLDQTPTCLAVEPATTDESGRIYVGCRRQVLVLDGTGQAIGAWPDFGPQAVLTAIAVGGQRVFVADAGQRVVHVLDREGRPAGQIGTVDPDRSMPGFVIPSAYFDLAVGPDETLWVVNPGMRRIESYSFTGELQSLWGRAGADVAGFFGCCNPAHLALLPDGRFVTSEKGIPRIKVYSESGEFQHVVVGARGLGVRASSLVDARGESVARVFDVAVAPDGAILVLDAFERCVRVFYPKGAEGPQS